MASHREDSFTPIEDDEAVTGASSPDMDEAAGSPGSDPGGPSSDSVMEDVEALIEDSLNYLDAELAFQKTRARFAGDSIKKAIMAGLLALVLALLAIFGLVFGLILALTPLITAWGATALVVGLLLLSAYLLVRKAGSLIAVMSSHFASSATADEPATGNHDV